MTEKINLEVNVEVKEAFITGLRGTMSIIVNGTKQNVDFLIPVKIDIKQPV